MSKKHLTEIEVNILSNNPNANSDSTMAITYTMSFKRKFIFQNEKENEKR
jgi:hypothetical protein